MRRTAPGARCDRRAGAVIRRSRNSSHENE
jgi:hypothetical protein